MIVLVHASERDRFPVLMNQMHALRARVFKNRLRWKVDVVDGKERDRFDDLDPLYVLSVTEEGQVVGSLRALQTTGPNMLSDVFPELLPPGMAVRSPLVWESTRFVVDTEYAKTQSANALSKITGELLCGLFEAGLAAGLEFVVSVFDLRMERILIRANCKPERLGPPVDIDGVMTVAGLFEVSEEMVAGLHAASGITEPVIRVGEVQLLRFAA